MRAAQTGVDALQQMRFAGADRTMQDNGIGPLARRFDHAQRGRVRHSVAGADDEIAQAMPAAGAPRRFAHLLGRGGLGRRLRFLNGLVGLWMWVLSGWVARFGPRGFGRGGFFGVRLADLILFASRCLEQFRIDDETDLHGLAEDFLRGGDRGGSEVLFDPFAEMPIGYADGQLLVFPLKTGAPREP